MIAVAYKKNNLVMDSNSFYNFFTEVCYFEYESDGIYTKYHVNPNLGDGYIEQIRFSNGLEFCITSLQLKQSISLNYQLKDAPLEVHYMLGGNVYHYEKSMGDMNLSEGRLSTFFCKEMEGVMTLVAGRKIVYITMMVGDKALNNILGACQCEYSADEQRMSNKMKKFVKPRYPTADMKAIFAQILSCSLSNISKSVFLQGKATELVAYIWEQFTAEQRLVERIPLHSYEITALEKAKELIESNMENPYGIEEIANLVGLNSVKFKKGFKQNYEITPHQYLIKCRMIRARQLMRDKEYTVTETAFAVGYTNVSYFSKVFREYFGQTPKHFRFGL